MGYSLKVVGELFERARVFPTSFNILTVSQPTWPGEDQPFPHTWFLNSVLTGHFLEQLLEIHQAVFSAQWFFWGKWKTIQAPHHRWENQNPNIQKATSTLKTLSAPQPKAGQWKPSTLLPLDPRHSVGGGVQSGSQNWSCSFPTFFLDKGGLPVKSVHILKPDQSSTSTY